MSLVPTGLGWSAEGEYIHSLAGTRLCDVTEKPSTVTSIVPVTSQTVNTSVLSSDGILFMTRDYGTSNVIAVCTLNGARVYPRVYIAGIYTSSGEGEVCVAIYPDDPLFSSINSVDFKITLYFMASWGLNDATCRTNTWFEDSDAIKIIGFPVYFSSPITFHVNTIQVASGQSTSDVVKAFFAASSTSYFKLNDGVCTACVATWYSPEAEITSPVLISTVPEYTEITTDGTTPVSGLTTFDFLHQGARFYMSTVGSLNGVTPQVAFVDLRQFGASMPVKVFRLLADPSIENIFVGSPGDPYGVPPSEEEGGGGDETEDDPVEEETMPLPTVANLGFCTVYVPSQAELIQMASYLWGGSFDVDMVIKLFSNPMDSIIGLSAVPVDLVGSPSPISLGGIQLTGITMPKYTGRTSVKVDMGSVTLTERYGAYLDYDPYTQLSIYVPFIGIKNLKTDDLMGKTVSLMYDIDILTGACVAYLRPAGGSVLYEWCGQCAVQIPVTGANWDTMFRNAVSAATVLGTAMFSPASAPVLAGAVASAAVQAIASKPQIERSGSVTGVAGYLGQLRPYIIRINPEAYIPDEQNKQIGYPAYITMALSGAMGYNEVASIHLENIPATSAEIDEIENLLKGGVIF